MNERVIKFRIWDVRSNKFRLPLRDYSIYSVENSTQELRSDENYIFQKFTCSLDKNKKEIYEGDILELESHGKTWRLTVEYHKNGLIVADSKNGYIDIVANINEKCKVIGNIFENPSLLAAN